MAGHPLRDRPVHRGRLLLRPRAAGSGLRDRPPEDRGPHARARRRRSAVRARGGFARRRARAVRGSALQARDHRVARGGRGPRRRHGHDLPQRGLGGPVPGSPRALDRPSEGVQADEARGRVLARGRGAADAHPDLRDGVVHAEGAALVPAPPGGGREARPSQARPRARPVLVPRGARPGSGRVASQGRDLPQAARGLRARPASRTRVRPRRDAEPRAPRAVGHLGPHGEVRRPDVPRDAARGRSGVLRQADELPVPRARVQVADPFVPRPADPALGARERLPVRASRRRARAAARARFHPGRLAHHLSRGPARRRDPGRVRPDPRDPSHVRVHRAGGHAVHAAGGDDRDARDGGARDRAPCATRSIAAGSSSGSPRARGRSTGRRSTSTSAMRSGVCGS